MTNTVTYLDINLLPNILDTVISKAFTHEREFLTNFWCGNPNDELIELYMASERSRIAVITSSGATVTDTISTAEFINWISQFP